MPDLDALIAEAEGLCAAATPGPWEVVSDYPALAIKAGRHAVVQTPNQNNYRHFGRSESWLGIESYSNANFIARARTLIPELLAALRQRPGREEVALALRDLWSHGRTRGHLYDAENERDGRVRQILRDLGYGAGDGR